MLAKTIKNETTGCFLKYVRQPANNLIFIADLTTMFE